MFLSHRLAAIVFLQALAVAGAALGFGYLLVDAVIGGRAVDKITRWGLALSGVVTYSFVAMLLHIVTDGHVLSSPLLVRGATGLTAAGSIALKSVRRRRGVYVEKFGPWEAQSIFGLCVLGIIVWCLPVSQALPLHFTPDTDLHMGWASQIMVGEPTPSAVITGEVPGYYPWLYHGLVALLAPFTPGGTAFHALGPLQVMQVIGAIIALVALGRQVTGKLSGGGAAAVFGALSGGLGIGLLWRLDALRRLAETDATAFTFLGDVFSRRPYNLAFNNLAPPYPRDLSFSLLLAFLLLLAVGLKRKNNGALAGAGVTLGLVGLTGGEAFIVGAGVAALACILLAREMGTLRSGVVLFVAAMLVYGTWLAPTLFSFAKLGGFVNTTRVAPVILSPLGLVVSWGIVVPFALYGAFLFLPRTLTDPRAGIPLAVIVVTGSIMLTNGVSRIFGPAFLTLGRDHRYWALLYLGVALYGAAGWVAVYERIRHMHLLAVGISVILVVAAALSPLLGSLFYRVKYPPNQLIGATLQGERTLLRAMNPAPGRRCVVAVPNNMLARQVFAYTGYRLVLWVRRPGTQNWARIRWRDIYQQIPGDQERLRANRIVTNGKAPPAVVRAVIDDYDINWIVTTAGDAPLFRGYQKVTFDRGRTPLTLVRVKECPRA